jgi:HTH-type transcriptional regulator / antitoxin HipB
MIPITSSETLGKVLRMYRKQQHLTQAEAGRKFSMTQKTVSLIEAGKQGIRLETLFNIMSALGLELHLEPRVKSIKEKGLWQ